MSHNLEPQGSSNAPTVSGANRVVLEVRGLQVPSFKNRKRSGLNRQTGKMMSYTPKNIKQRMASLEDAILQALCSACLTAESETPLECLSRLQTLLSGLSDDSIYQIPKGSFDTEWVSRGNEGVQITIEKLF